jgi:hypothetical protein
MLGLTRPGANAKIPALVCTGSPRGPTIKESLQRQTGFPNVDVTPASAWTNALAAAAAGREVAWRIGSAPPKTKNAHGQLPKGVTGGTFGGPAVLAFRL